MISWKRLIAMVRDTMIITALKNPQADFGVAENKIELRKNPSPL